MHPVENLYLFPIHRYLPLENINLFPIHRYLPLENLYLFPIHRYLPLENLNLFPIHRYLPLENLYLFPIHRYLHRLELMGVGRLAMAQCIRLLLPSSSLGFKSQVHHSKLSWAPSYEYDFQQKNVRNANFMQLDWLCQTF